MTGAGTWQTRIERWSLYFQGGVRRAVLIFLGISILLLTPSYFFGQFSSYLFGKTWIDDNNTVNTKELVINDFEVSDTQIVELANNQKELYVSVNNKNNPTIGFAPWVYTVQILDDEGSIISQKTNNSYILPEENTFVVVRSENNEGSKINLITEPSTNPVKYNPNNNKLKKPNVKILNQRIINEKDNENLIIQGTFLNEDLVEIKTVNVLFIIRDNRESVIGIGTYSFNGFGPKSQRSFELEYPKPANRDPKILDLRWSVNYLDPNSFTF
ncbi:hypothetical protein HC766_01805 [Candidatus Gracilibacteria bacterium]|nr:hypothetical protein [Candidatus Gracilibacteria bacterium]NJS41102.1 hypothetical protein [Candidatus Gracilibacteria bacterium]